MMQCSELISFALFVFPVSHDCCVTLPRVCLQFVIVVFSVHTIFNLEHTIGPFERQLSEV